MKRVIFVVAVNCRFSFFMDIFRRKLDIILIEIYTIGTKRFKRYTINILSEAVAD